MRTEERLRKLGDWTYRTVCKDRQMKAPAANMDVRQIVRQEPKVFIGYAPTRPDTSEYSGDVDPLTVAPGIILAPVNGDVHYQEEKRFDRYNNVHRSQDFGQSLTVQNVFMVFEDGIRLPGFIDAAKTGEYPMNLIKEGTQEGLFTLTNWMDDYKDALLSVKNIPGTDLVVNDEVFEYGWYSDQKFISDRRPCFIGMVTVKFQCYAQQYNEELERLLR